MCQSLRVFYILSLSLFFAIVCPTTSKLVSDDFSGEPELTSLGGFVIKGVVWSPASKTTQTWKEDSENANKRRIEFGNWYQTDIPLMKSMNVNTIRLTIDLGYDEILGPVGREILDALHANHIRVIMTVDDGINDMERIENAVNYYKDHPAIILWLLGNEWNINLYYGVAANVQEAAERTEAAAQLVKQLDPSRPVATSYGDININADGLRLADTAHYVNDICPSVDVWMLNIYRGMKFFDLFNQWHSITQKPMLLGEFGIDAYDYNSMQVDEPTQAAWNQALWDDMLTQRQLMGSFRAPANNPSHPQVLVNGGGTVFEWNDEWWKIQPSNSQENGGWSSGGFPDGVGNEEYFGIVDIERQPRLVFTALQTAFASGYRPVPPAIEFSAYSCGTTACGPPTYGRAIFRVDGLPFYNKTGGAGGGRGINVAVIDGQTGDITVPGVNFDTWITRNSGTAMYQMIEFLDSISDGDIVMFAVCDDAGLNEFDACERLSYPWVEAGIQKLEEYGSTQIQDYCYRDSWSMIAIKGAGDLSQVDRNLDEVHDTSSSATAEAALRFP